MRWWSLVCREANSTPAAGGGGGSAASGERSFTSAEIKKIASEVANEPDLARAVQNVIETHGGNKDKGIDYALRRGYSARKQRDAALRENERVATLIPATNDFVVRGEDATHVKSIVDKAKKAGLSLAELAGKVDSIPQIERENSDLKLANTASEVADALKLNKAALSKAVTDDGRVLYKRTITVTKKVDGKDVRTSEEQWHVRGVDEKDDKGIPVTDYVDKHVFKSAIMSRGTQSDASSSVDWPSQQQSSQSNGSTSSSAAVNDLVGKTLDRLNERATAPSALSFAFPGGSQPTPPHSGAGAEQEKTRR